MIFYLLLCLVLFVPFTNTSNTTISQQEILNKTLSEPEPRKVNLSNETKVTLLSEGGGSLLPGTVLALAKDKLTSLDSEMGKNKVRPVVARKGVVYTEDENLKPQENNATTNNQNPATVATKLPEKAHTLKKNKTGITNKTLDSKLTNSTLLIKLSSDVKNTNKTEIPKKPLILSYDTLANMTVKSSPGTLVSDQMPSKDLKAYAKNANSHPGMIMPLVISILLVPMFAVLGYMALRRGQEAWKNRHYKRMDFLLDGMYND